MTTVSTPSSLPRIDIEGDGANYGRDTYGYEHTRTRAGRAEEDVLSAFPVPPSHIPSSPSFPPVRSSSLVSVPSLRIGSPPASPYSHPASGSGSARQHQQQRQQHQYAPSAYTGKSTGGVRRKDGPGDTGDVSEFGSKRDSGLSVDHLSVRSGAAVGTPTSGRSYYTAPSTPMALTPSTAGSSSGGVGEALDYFVLPSSSQSPRSSSSSSSPPIYKSKRSSGASSGMSPISEHTPTSSAPPSAFAFPIASSPLPPGDSPTDAAPAIGAPPCVPLPPLPRTPSTVSELTARAFAAQQEARRGDAASIASSGRSTRSGRTSHGRKESSASALSVMSSVSAGPSLSEFGMRTPNASVSGGTRKGSTGREKSRTPRPLRIDIPPTPSVSSSGSASIGTGVRSMGSLRSVGSLGSPTSLIMSPPSPSPSAFDRLREKVREEEMERGREREKGMEMERQRERERAKWKEEGSTKSPTASLFSVASVASVTTTRSGMSAAESLRTRVSGMLDGLGTASAITSANVSPNSSTASTSVGRVRHGSGDSHVSEIGNGNAAVSVSVIGSGADDITGRETPQPPQQKCSQASLNLALSTQSSSMNLLVAEDLHADPLLARAVTPFMPTTPSRSGKNAYPEGGVNTSPSPLEMANMARTLRAMSGARSPLPSSLSPIPPLSDVDDDDDRMGADHSPLSSAGLLGQFPATPTSHAMVSQSFTTPSTMPTKAPSNGLLTASTGTSANGGILRTMSQSRRKPLPHAPLDTGSTLGPTPESEEAETSTPRRKDSRSGRRGRDSVPRNGGATSPDIASMMCATPRPVRSVSSARSSGSGSMRASKRDLRARPRPSLPSERERERALARASRASSAFSGSSSVSRLSQSSVREDPEDGDMDLEGAYGGIMLEVDPDASADYGVAIARHRGGYDLSPRFGVNEVASRDEMHVDELGGAGRDDDNRGTPDEQEVSESDSDIDLHTPLPHILLREGVLSPHSKVLASVVSCSSLSSRGSLGSMGGLSGRESVVSNMTNVSIGSVMTKSGLYKDERDTERRRKRHRDGNLLREGLGLTTGLGWSDSEDEDAPSPLTHSLSKLALSRNNSMASFRSSSSKQSQFFMKSTPAVSRTSSTSSNRPNLNSSRSFYNSSGLARGSAPHPLSKPHSSTGLARSGPSPYAQHLNSKGREYEGVREGERSMSPSPVSGATSSSSVSLAFPPTPRDDDLCDSASDFNLLSSSSGIYKGRKQESVESGSLRAKTPTASLSKPSQLAMRNRPRALSSSKSAPASTPDSATDEPVPAVPRSSRLPGSGMTTPRPLRLPALQQQQMQAFGDREKEKPLQPGEPAPRSGSILGYNRNLHGKQRAQLLAARAATSESSPSSPASPASPALSAYSAPPSSAYGGRRTYGSMPSVSVLRPPSSVSAATARTPSPSRLSAPTAGITGKPRTGTGMVYRQSSLPPPRAGSTKGRPTAV